MKLIKIPYSLLLVVQKHAHSDMDRVIHLSFYLHFWRCLFFSLRSHITQQCARYTEAR